MKALFCAGLLGTMLSFSFSASAEVIFRGSLVYTGASNCSFSHVGNDYNSVYHPRGAGNENFTGLTQLYPHGGASYHLDNGDFTATFKNVRTAGLGWSHFTWTGSQVLVTQRVPAKIEASTRFVTLKGQIKRPENDPGVGATKPCIVTFEASYRRHLSP